MKRILLTTALAIGLTGLVACNSDSEIVVKTKDGNVTKDQLYDELVNRHGAEVLRDLVTLEVLGEQYEVSDKDIDNEIERIKDQLGEQYEMWLQQEGLEDEDALRNIIQLSLLQESAVTKDIDISEDEMKEEYDKVKTEIQAEHILVEDEDTAEKVKKKLDEGEDFANLAKEYSTDEGTVEDGGKLDYFSSGEMVPEFEEEAYNIELDTISEPVQSQFGFHILRVTDKRENEDVESYEDMKEEIRRNLLNEKIDPAVAMEKMEEILADAKIDVKIKKYEDLFEPEPAPEG